jgi:hypothetical protein
MIVSLCTVCKNRSTHFKTTILQNIADNINDPNIEFVLLDYNSEDDLEEWVKANLKPYIDSGVFTYYKTTEPQYFHRSHSRNMAFRLAKGEILCNVDADNFTGPSFTDYLRNCFQGDGNVFVCAGGQVDGLPYSDIGGRIGIRQTDFLGVGGYDENMSNYGSEDFDLIGRLEMNGTEKILIRNFEYMKVIKHDTKNRIYEEYPYKNLKNIFVHYIDPTASKILFLFNDNRFAMGTLSMGRSGQPAKNRGNVSHGGNYNAIHVNEDKWIMGSTVIHSDGKIVFMDEQPEAICSAVAFEKDGRLLLNEDSDELTFYALKNVTLVELMLLLYSEKGNLAKLIHNQKLKIINPNNTPIGTGVVYKNFDYHNPIIL